MLGACGEDPSPAHDVVARVRGEGLELELERVVVEHIAARDGVSEDDARARALASLRLVAARRAELDAREQPPEHPDDLDPARRDQLERAALVRVWLDETFEPSHRGADIPQRVIDQNMADPRQTRRLFHPRLWFVCQVLVVPAGQSEDGDPVKAPSDAEANEQWRAAAGRAFADMVARVEQLEPDLLGEDGCALLGRVVGSSKRDFDTEAGPVTIRYESFAFAPSQAASFDAQWLEAVTARAEPGIIGPFATQFGLHLVVVSKIEAAQLEDASLPEAQLLSAREAHLRAQIETAWQADQLQQTLAEIRERRIVRLSPELERGP